MLSNSFIRSLFTLVFIFSSQSLLAESPSPSPSSSPKASASPIPSLSPTPSPSPSPSPSSTTTSQTSCGTIGDACCNMTGIYSCPNSTNAICNMTTLKCEQCGGEGQKCCVGNSYSNFGCSNGLYCDREGTAPTNKCYSSTVHRSFNSSTASTNDKNYNFANFYQLSDSYFDDTLNPMAFFDSSITSYEAPLLRKVQFNYINNNAVSTGLTIPDGQKMVHSLLGPVTTSAGVVEKCYVKAVKNWVVANNVTNVPRTLRDNGYYPMPIRRYSENYAPGAPVGEEIDYDQMALDRAEHALRLVGVVRYATTNGTKLVQPHCVMCHSAQGISFAADGSKFAYVMPGHYGSTNVKNPDLFFKAFYDSVQLAASGDSCASTIEEKSYMAAAYETLFNLKHRSVNPDGSINDIDLSVNNLNAQRNPSAYVNNAHRLAHLLATLTPDVNNDKRYANGAPDANHAGLKYSLKELRTNPTFAPVLKAAARKYGKMRDAVTPTYEDAYITSIFGISATTPKKLFNGTYGCKQLFQSNGTITYMDYTCNADQEALGLYVATGINGPIGGISSSTLALPGFAGVDPNWEPQFQPVSGADGAVARTKNFFLALGTANAGHPTIQKILDATKVTHTSFAAGVTVYNNNCASCHGTAQFTAGYLMGTTMVASKLILTNDGSKVASLSNGRKYELSTWVNDLKNSAINSLPGPGTFDPAANSALIKFFPGVVISYNAAPADTSATPPHPTGFAFSGKSTCFKDLDAFLARSPSSPAGAVVGQTYDLLSLGYQTIQSVTALDSAGLATLDQYPSYRHWYATNKTWCGVDPVTKTFNPALAGDSAWHGGVTSLTAQNKIDLKAFLTTISFSGNLKLPQNSTPGALLIPININNVQ